MACDDQVASIYLVRFSFVCFQLFHVSVHCVLKKTRENSGLYVILTWLSISPLPRIPSDPLPSIETAIRCSQRRGLQSILVEGEPPDELSAFKQDVAQRFPDAGADKSAVAPAATARMAQERRSRDAVRKADKRFRRFEHGGGGGKEAGTVTAKSTAREAQAPPPQPPRRRRRPQQETVPSTTTAATTAAMSNTNTLEHKPLSYLDTAGDFLLKRSSSVRGRPQSLSQTSTSTAPPPPASASTSYSRPQRHLVTFGAVYPTRAFRAEVVRSYKDELSYRPGASGLTHLPGAPSTWTDVPYRPTTTISRSSWRRATIIGTVRHR